MTNITAVIIVTVATNWVTTGTFTPVEGNPEEVQVGRFVTNHTAIIEWKGKRHEMIVESITGPTCGERRIPKTSYKIQWTTNSNLPGGLIIMTNINVW